MNIISRIIGIFNPEVEKLNKFSDFDKQHASDKESAQISKAIWLTSRGNYYANRNKHDLAIKDYDEAITIKPDYTVAYIALGIAYRNIGMIDKALSVLLNAPTKTIFYEKELLDIEPDLYEALASTYILKGDKQMAVEYLRKARRELKTIHLDKKNASNTQLEEINKIIRNHKKDMSVLIEELEGSIRRDPFSQDNINKPLKILSISEDDGSNDSIAMIFDIKHYYVNYAHNLQEALLEMNVIDYDMVIINEYHAGGLPGITVLEQIKTTHPKTEVVIYSTMPREENRNRAIELGVLAFISAPFLMEELFALADKVISKKH